MCGRRARRGLPERPLHGFARCLLGFLAEVHLTSCQTHSAGVACHASTELILIDSVGLDGKGTLITIRPAALMHLQRAGLWGFPVKELLLRPSSSQGTGWAGDECAAGNPFHWSEICCFQNFHEFMLLSPEHCIKEPHPLPCPFPHTHYFLLSVRATEFLGSRCLWPTTLRQSHKQGLSKTLVRIERACMFGGGDRP